MKILKYIPLALLTAALLSCSETDPYKDMDLAALEGITSVTARFTTGPYASDPSAVFTAMPDASGKVVIEIPWFYPTDTDNTVDPAWLDSLRVSAVMQSGTYVKPGFGLTNLSSENLYRVTDPVGRTRDFSVIAKIVKLSGCDIESFRLTSAGTDYDGIIDQSKNTISVITTDDVLPETSLAYRLSDHATMDGYTEGMDIHDGDKFKVTAHNGVDSKEYTLLFAVPEKIGYGANKAFKQAWKKWYGANLGITLGAGMVRMAASGDYLVVMNAGRLYLLNRFTGAFIQEISLSGYDIKSIVSDEAGHILFSNEGEFNGAPFEVYYIDDLMNPQPVKLLEYTQADIWGSTIGNIKVVGDIKTKATVTAFANVNNMPVYWTVENGVASKVAWTSGFYPGANVWGLYNGSATSATADPADGFFGVGYAGNYNIEYFNGSSWSDVYTTGFEGNENPCTLSTITFNGARYLAFGVGAHFSWGYCPAMVVMDSSVPSTMSDAILCDYNVWTMDAGAFVGATGAACDVLLVASADGYKMHAYYTDGNYDMIICIEFDCIAR